jgi:hypothetical protein
MKRGCGVILIGFAVFAIPINTDQWINGKTTDFTNFCRIISFLIDANFAINFAINFAMEDEAQ